MKRSRFSDEQIAGLLGRDDITDLYANRPGEISAETLGGGIERHDVPDLDATLLARVVGH